MKVKAAAAKTTVSVWMISLGLGLTLPATALDLTESTFIQVVNDVSVIHPETKVTAPARLKDVVKAPMLVRTGPNSRAELKAPDQTLTRVGANTIFAFEPKGRNIQLKQGTLLFHSPTGRGGGTIKTGGASAAVLGTTLMIVATPDGGFKGIVLEGKGKFTLPNGSSRQIKAGELLFVLPGAPGFGPKLQINLSKMVEGSGLVKGYTAELPSLPKVQAAISQQDHYISTGQLQDTGILVGNKATKDTVSVIDSATFVAAIEENKSRIEKAWDDRPEVQGPLLGGSSVFSREDPKYPRNSVGNDFITYAFLGEDITLKTQGILLPEDSQSGSGPGTFGIVAKDKLTISGDVDFFAPGSRKPDLVLAGDRIDFDHSPHIRYLEAQNLALISRETMKLSGGSVESGGDLKVISLNHDLKAEGTRFRAQGILTLQADNDITLQGGTLAAQQIHVEAGAFGKTGKKDNAVSVQNVNFRGPSLAGSPSLIRFEGTTLIFQQVNFSSGTTINMNAPYGLAPNPNSGAAVLNGYVNFVREVTVDGKPAQDYVRGNDHPYGNIVIGGSPPALAKK